MTTYTLEAAKKAAPSLFASHAHPDMSRRYTFLSTAALLEPLVAEGWQITNVGQRIARRRDPNFTRHVVRVRPPLTKALTDVGDAVPEVVITNSHDGQSKLILMAALFRLVCTNGLVVSSMEFGGLSIRHAGDIEVAMARVQEALTRSTDSLDQVHRMQQVNLTREQQLGYASNVSKLVWGADDFDTSRLLEARRSADAGDDVWHVFNRVQENVMRGGLPIHREHNTRASVTRGITHIGRSIDLNLALWNEALKLAA
ncbi:MAG: DUF945 domain-containing protein [Chromatiaceae bacterium]|nr:DUF945 domain-containing protein [Candidatus Thioaporhodococcus sediminis]